MKTITGIMRHIGLRSCNVFLKERMTRQMLVALTFYRCFQCFLSRSVKSAALWPDGGVHSLLLSLCVAVHVVIWTLCVVLFCASCLCFCLLRSQSCSAEAGCGRSAWLSHTLQLI